MAHEYLKPQLPDWIFITIDCNKFNCMLFILRRQPNWKTISKCQLQTQDGSLIFVVPNSGILVIPCIGNNIFLRILKTITFTLETLLSLNVHSILTSLLTVFREVALWTKVHKNYFLFHKSTHLSSSNYAFLVIVWTQSPESLYLLILLSERREKWFALSEAIAIL